jgi:hypothetical protein
MKQKGGRSESGKIVAKFWVINIVLLVLPTIYWLSYIMAWGLGTDYVMDVLVEGVKTYQVGRLGIYVMNIVLPIICLGIDWKKFRKEKILGVRECIIASVILAGLGVVSVIIG